MTSVTYQLNAFFLTIDKCYSSSNIISINQTLADIENMVQQFIDCPCDIKEFVDSHSDIMIGYKAASLTLYRFFETESDSNNLKIILRSQLAYFQNKPEFLELSNSLALIYKTSFNSINLLKEHNSTGEFVHHPIFADWLSLRIQLEFCILTGVVLYHKNLSISATKIKELSDFAIDVANEFDTVTQKLKNTLHDYWDNKGTITNSEPSLNEFISQKITS